MSQIEVEVEDVQSFEEMVDEVEDKSPTDFIDIDSAEDLKSKKNINELKTELVKYAMLPSVFSGTCGIPGGIWLGISQYLSMGNELEAGTAALGGLTFSVLGIGTTKKLSDKKIGLEDRLDRVESQLDNWYELPGQADLSYLVDDGFNQKFEKPYREWLGENLLEWSEDAYIADMTNIELGNLGVDEVDLSVEPENYGNQRVYLEKLKGVSAPIEEEGFYKFKLETYDNGEIMNVYWGITDEKGRHMVQNNDAAKKYDTKSEKFK